MAFDLTGEHGGLMASAFASGCAATFVFISAIGKYMWKVLGKAKDDAIEDLKKRLDENDIKHAAAIKEERDRCDALEIRQNKRIRQLEDVVLETAAPRHRERVRSSFNRE